MTVPRLADMMKLKTIFKINCAEKLESSRRAVKRKHRAAALDPSATDRPERRGEKLASSGTQTSRREAGFERGQNVEARSWLRAGPERRGEKLASSGATTSRREAGFERGHHVELPDPAAGRLE